MLALSALHLCICSAYVASICEAYKVLVVFPTPTKSHAILSDGVVKSLFEAGHEVTYVTAFPKAINQHPSLREIDLSALLKLIPEKTFSIDKLLKKEVDMQGITSLIPIFLNMQVACLENENFNKILGDPKERFDVLILEWMFVDLLSGISAVFNCPYIWMSTVDPHWMVLRLIDDIPNPAYTTSMTSNNAMPLSFLQRADELMQLVLGLGVKYFYISDIEHREYERLLAPIIRKRGQTVPDFEEVRYNASLMFGNSHVSMGQSIRLPQSYKAIGGYHIDANTKALPKDLKILLDNAKHGLIYFSMGTVTKSKYMPAELKINLLKMFGKLKQTVLWKFEEDLPSRPSNVHIVQWAPQQSILAHPNCVIFITHGGLLSVTEAIHFGKPIIAMPLFGDQFTNVDKNVKRGIAKRVEMSYTMPDDLEKAIKDMLADSSYSNKVKILSAIYHDRPISPGKELVHWVEHVARTGGASHLRSPALRVPWYQKCYLDLVVLCVATLWVMMLTSKQIIVNFSSKQQKKKIY